MVGLLMSVGNFGAVVATTPLAWAAGRWGWRPTFLLIGGATLGMAAAMLLATRDAPPAHLDAAESANASSTRPQRLGRDLLTIVGSGQFWLVVTVFFGIYGTAVTLQGLWATPFLMTALGVERILASQLNMLIPIGVIVGAPLFGWLPNRLVLNQAHTLTAIIAVYTLGWTTILVFFDRLGVWGCGLVFSAMGLMIGGFISTIWGLIQAATPAERLGLTSGILNPAPFLGVAAFQVLTGSIIDRAGRVGDLYPLAGFRSAFGVCLAGAAVCLLLSGFIKARPAGG